MPTTNRELTPQEREREHVRRLQEKLKELRPGETEEGESDDSATDGNDAKVQCRPTAPAG